MSEVTLMLISTTEDFLLCRSFCEKCTPNILKEKKDITIYNTFPLDYDETAQFKKLGLRCLDWTRICKCPK